MEHEGELVARARAGSAEAFEELVRKTIDEVYSFVYRLTSNQALAEDVTQETFVKVWRSLGSFDQKRALTPWLLTIARNTALDAMRKKHSTTFSDIGSETFDFAATIADESPLPDSLFADAELGKKVAQGVETLPERDRSVLSLHYEHSLSFEEIAEILGAPMNTVKSWHRRALARLRDLLRPYAPNDD